MSLVSSVVKLIETQSAATNVIPYRGVDHNRKAQQAFQFGDIIDLIQDVMLIQGDGVNVKKKK